MSRGHGFSDQRATHRPHTAVGRSDAEPPAEPGVRGLLWAAPKDAHHAHYSIRHARYRALRNDGRGVSILLVPIGAFEQALFGGEYFATQREVAGNLPRFARKLRGDALRCLS